MWKLIKHHAAYCFANVFALEIAPMHCAETGAAYAATSPVVVFWHYG
jgi:hypothetical protein